MIITAGAGRQFVGEGVSPYKAGDLTLIGSNVPHLHLCNSILNGTGDSKSSEKCYSYLHVFSLNI